MTVKVRGRVEIKGPSRSWLYRRLYSIVVAIYSQKNIYTVSQINCADLSLLQLRQISTKLDNFWQKDGKEAKIISDGLIFHLT